MQTSEKNDYLNSLTLSPSIVLRLTRAIEDNNFRDFINLLPLLKQIGIDSILIKDYSSLALSAKYGRLNMAKALIQSGASTNSKYVIPRRALQLAAEFGNTDIILLLINSGAKIGFGRNNSSSALRRACRKGHYESVQILLENGAYINSCSSTRHLNGLHLTAKNGDLKTFTLLEKNGADLDAKARNGKTPKQYAEENGHEEIVNYINLITNKENNKIANAKITPLFSKFSQKQLKTEEVISQITSNKLNLML